MLDPEARKGGKMANFLVRGLIFSLDCVLTAEGLIAVTESLKAE